MIPSFFGDSDAPLFGVLHPPSSVGGSSSSERNHAVLLCPPIGQEYVRSHWAMRQIALALAKAGFHCFRFDWFGVGDSAGDLRDATLHRWAQDAVTAATELRDSTGVSRLSVLGLRLGGTIAAMAAKRIKPAAIVLWDPVTDGPSYLGQLRSLHESMVADSNRYWNRGLPRHRPATELVGFDLGADLVKDIETLRVDALTDLPRARVSLLRSGTSTLDAYEAALRQGGHELELRVTAMDGKWTSPDQVEELLLPADVVHTVVEMLGSR